MFPNKKNVQPRYDQISIKEIEKNNTFNQILSPSSEDEGVWVHQDAWFHIGKFDAGQEANYKLRKEGNGLYAFILNGEVEIEGQKLGKRDGFGLWDTSQITLKATTEARVLLMDVPMEF